MTELTALRELKRGSQEALAWFIQKYGAYVSTIVTNIIQASMSPADVEEVTADVFFALWEQADQLKLSSVKSYLAGIARNKAKNKLRELGCTVPLNDDLILIDEISPEDMYATVALCRGLAPLGVAVVDHLIVAGDDCTSLRDSGLLHEKQEKGKEQ